MKSIQEISKQAAVDYLKFKLGDRKGFNVYDIDASDADELIAEIEKECVVSFMDFLAAVDAERGKDAAAYAVRNDFEGSFFEYIAMWPETCHEHINAYYERVLADGDQPEKCTVVPLFLSPTIPAWISIIDSLPAEETPVLIIYNGNVVVGERRWEHPTFEDSFESHWYWDDPTDDGQDWGRDEVTHWMPLPPPAGVTK